MSFSRLQLVALHTEEACKNNLPIPTSNALIAWKEQIKAPIE